MRAFFVDWSVGHQSIWPSVEPHRVKPLRTHDRCFEGLEEARLAADGYFPAYVRYPALGQRV
jgi:hypothetical protein